MPLDHQQIYIKKKALLSTLRHIEDIHKHQNYFVRNLRKTVALGLLISLCFPAQGLGSYALKGPSILVLANMGYWEMAISTAFLYGSCCVLGHYVWKWHDETYLKELYEKKDQLMKELGFE